MKISTLGEYGERKVQIFVYFGDYSAKTKNIQDSKSLYSAGWDGKKPPHTLSL
jgi:hypothetical protein